MKNKRTTIRKTAFFILFLLFSLALGYFLGKLGAQAATDISKGAVIALALLFIPIFFIVIGVHEAGHALAGNLVKFDFRMYVVGPFMWQKEQSIWKFSWNKNVNIAGGMVVCVPTTTENLVRRFSVYAAGGPLASVVLAVLSYGIYRLISGGNVTGHIGLEIIVYFFMIMAMLSLIIFIVTAVPLHTGGFSSDGARVLRLLRGGDTARFETLILKFIASSSGGVRPKMINMDELLEAQKLAEKLNAPFGVYLHSFFHQGAFDRGDLESAEKHLQDYLSHMDEIPAGLRNVVLLDAAFFYAFAKNDLETAMAYWQRFQTAALIPKAQIFATEASIAFLKADYKLAKIKIESSLQELPNMIDRGVGFVLQERLLTMRATIEGYTNSSSEKPVRTTAD